MGAAVTASSTWRPCPVPQHGPDVAGCVCAEWDDVRENRNEESVYDWDGEAQLDRLKFYISEFDSQQDNRPKVRRVTWNELVDRLTARPAVVRERDQRPAWSPASYPMDVTRCDDNVRAVSLLVADVDDGTDPVRALEVLFPEYARLIHTSWSHQREKKKAGACARWRLVVPLADPVPPKEWAVVWRRLQHAAKLAGITIDPAVNSPSEIYFRPCLQDEDQPWFAEARAGQLLDWRDLPEAPEPAPPPKRPPPDPSVWNGAGDVARRLLAKLRAMRDRVPTDEGAGGRNELMRVARIIGGHLAHYRLDVEPFVAELVAGMPDRWSPERAVRSAVEDGANEPLPLDERPQRPAEPPPDPGARVVERLRAIRDAPDDLDRKRRLDELLADPVALRGWRRPGARAGEVEAIRLTLPQNVRGALTRAARAVSQAAQPQNGDQEDPERAAVRQAISRRRDDGSSYVATTLHTAVVVLKRDPRWAGRIRRNELSGIAYVGDREAVPEVELEVAEWMEVDYGTEWPFTTVQRAIYSVAAQNAYHPVRDWLRGLPEWDGTPRLSRLLVDYFAVERDAKLGHLHAAYSRGLLISMVARALQPGCKVDQVLVLQGREGARKSSGLAALVPNRAWFHDDALPFDDEKRLGMLLRGPWLVEVAEFASMSRSNAENVKAVITRTHDRYVGMFARLPAMHPRGCVLVATVNPADFLPAAGRRWWVARVTGTVDVDAIARDRDQLFAEALAAYRAGEPWHLTAELEAQQREDVAAHTATDEWTDALAAFAATWTEGDLCGDDLAQRALGRTILGYTTSNGVSVAGMSMADQRSFGAAARAAGWVKVGGGRDGKRWRKPPSKR